MPRRLAAAEPGFDAAFDALVNARRGVFEDADETVAAILADVAARGDAALIEYTQRFDGFALTLDTLRLAPAEIEAASAEAPAHAVAALEFAAERITAYHRPQLPKDERYTDAAGVTLGVRWTPLDAVGLYVPGGGAAYPSSVLMNALPARVAGVGRLVMAVPTPGGALNPLVLAAARLAGIDEIYRVGGAQAIAALAYGTASIAPVDKIVGPGNAYVAAAKRRVFGYVGIDLIAGPSEILIVADAANDPAWIAADLLSQAEHDTAAQAILITDDAAFADAVATAIDSLLEELSESETARASWEQNGAVICVGSLDDAPELVNRLAPEHLALAVAAPEALADKVRHAGAIFLGRYTPEVIGDYVAGPNHVLPTARSARFSSGLSVLDFVKRTSIMACDEASFAKVAPAAAILAEAEGLPAHARSIGIRLKSR